MAEPYWTSLLFALPEEAAPLVKRLQRRDEGNTSRGPLLYWSERLRVSIYYSGMGAAAELRADYVMDAAYGRHRLIVCGFAGGLSDAMSPGDVLICDRAVTDSGVDYQADPALLEAAGSVSVSGITVRQGTLATAAHVLTRAAEKHALATHTRAVAVDMETVYAAKGALEYGAPWLAVRAITDGVSDDLPFDFNAFAGPDGLPDRNRIIQATLMHPWKIPALIRLGRRSSFAANNLTAFLEAFLDTLGTEE